MHAILSALAPHAILVGSTSVCNNYGDIDLVVSAKGLNIARRILPGRLSSEILGHLATDATEDAIECFRWWYGPSYRVLSRRKRELTPRTLHGVGLRAWCISPFPED